MSTRVDKGGPKFKPILKSRVRPSATPAPQDAHSQPPNEHDPTMPPPSVIPERAPSVAPISHTISTAPASSSSSNVITPVRSESVTNSPKPTFIAGPSRSVPIVVSRSTSTPLPNPVPSFVPAAPDLTDVSEGKDHIVSDSTDNETTGNEGLVPTPSTDGRSDIGRKQPKLSIVQAEKDRVKRPRRSKGKSRFAKDGGATAEGISAEEPELPPKKRSATARKKVAKEGPDNNASETPKPKRTRAKRNPSRNSTVDPGVTDADGGGSNSEQESSTIKKKKRRRATTTTAEELKGTPEPMDPTQITMGAICDDHGLGRLSSRWESSQVHYAEARKRAKEERARAIAEAAAEERETGRMAAKKSAPKPVLPTEQDGAVGEESVTEDTGKDPDEFSYAESLKASHYAPQVRIGANGEVVLDMESLQVDRAADPEIAEEAYSFVEESDQTRFTNSSSWSKRRSVRWGKEDTALFYDALRQYGQNFDLIARVLPGRTYQMCKKKFRAEDKKNPGLIDDALKNRATIDLNMLSRMTGKDFSGPTPIIEARKALDLKEDSVPAEQETSKYAEEPSAPSENLDTQD